MAILSLHFLEDPVFNRSFLGRDIGVVSCEVKCLLFQKRLILGPIGIVPLAQDTPENELQTKRVNGLTHQSCLVS